MTRSRAASQGLEVPTNFNTPPDVRRPKRANGRRSRTGTQETEEKSTEPEEKDVAAQDFATSTVVIEETIQQQVNIPSSASRREDTPAIERSSPSSDEGAPESSDVTNESIWITENHPVHGPRRVFNQRRVRKLRSRAAAFNANIVARQEAHNSQPSRDLVSSHHSFTVSQMLTMSELRAASTVTASSLDFTSGAIINS